MNRLQKEKMTIDDMVLITSDAVSLEMRPDAMNFLYEYLQGNSVVANDYGCLRNSDARLLFSHLRFHAYKEKRDDIKKILKVDYEPIERRYEDDLNASEILFNPYKLSALEYQDT